MGKRGLIPEWGLVGIFREREQLFSEAPFVFVQTASNENKMSKFLGINLLVLRALLYQLV